MNVKEIYQKRQNEFSLQENKTEKNLSSVSISRFISIVAAGIFWYKVVQEDSLLWTVAALGFSVLFFVLVVYFEKLKHRKEHLSLLKRINEEEKNYLEGDISAFENGNEFISTSHAYSYDLDIFGNKSIFQSLNRTATISGKKILAALLNKPLLVKKDITERQQAIKELSTQLEWRQEYRAYGLKAKEEPTDAEELLQWVKEPSIIPLQSWMKGALWLLPVISISTLLFWIITGNYFSVFGITALVNWTLIGFYVKKINQLHVQIARKGNITAKYHQLLMLIENKSFASRILIDNRDRSADASSALKKLKNLLNTFDYRLHVIFMMLANSVFLFDLQVVYRLEKWKKEYAQKLNAWIELAGTTDALNSLANYTYNHPEYSFPEIEESDKIVLNTTGIAHPLLSAAKAVRNDFSLGENEKYVLLTGANMAGKSTFLRSIGVNSMMAMAGLPVNAKTFSFTPAEIFSSMRVTDSLADDASYFKAEVLRLKYITEELAKGKKALVLLDEVLRGTNSDDKRNGTKALLLKMIQHKSIGILATHDLELSKMEQDYPGNFSNLSFESIIQGTELHFDYLLRKGPAKSTNASFILKNMGVTD